MRPRISSSACPTPATLPWPKMPKHPAKNGCRRPSRSLNCALRKRTSACAMVSRIVEAMIGKSAVFSSKRRQGSLNVWPVLNWKLTTYNCFVSSLIRIWQHHAANQGAQIVAGPEKLPQRPPRRRVAVEVGDGETEIVVGAPEIREAPVKIVHDRGIDRRVDARDHR